MEQTGNVVREERPSSRRLLKVLVDARKLGEGGIGTYLFNLLHGLYSSDAVDLTILCDAERAGALPIDVKVIEENARKYSFDELVLMPMRIPFRDYDIFHVPHYTLPYRVPIPTVITIHDLIHIYNPEKFYYPFVAGPFIHSAMKRATKIITVSHSSFQQIKKFSGHDPAIVSKLRIVPNSVEDGLLQAGSRPVAERRGDFFLAVFSNSKPHKGMRDLIDAFLAIGKESTGSFDKRLVLVGPGTEAIKGSNFGGITAGAGEIIALGEISREALHRLFATAAALILPSLSEGFCLPVLEAHAAGTPVITRPVPAVLELITPHDMICEDFSMEALIGAIRSFASRPTDCSDELRRQASRFSATSAAAAICDVYEEALIASKEVE